MKLIRFICIVTAIIAVLKAVEIVLTRLMP